MKTFMYMLSITLLLVSCKSVNKMVEKGEYAKAFDYAISKLSGARNKKKEHVMGLEKAYSKLTSTSLKEINRLNGQSRPENWPKIHDLYKGLADRQDRLEPLLPLTSEDGYVASFDMKDYNKELEIAEENMCSYLYNHALNLMAKTERSGDKTHARNAYSDLMQILKYRSSYKDTDRQVEKALDLGTNFVEIRINNDLRDFMSRTIERNIADMSLSRLNSQWTEFRMARNADAGADYTVWVDLNNIGFSPERERQNNYTESKEVIVKTEKVKERRDSVDVWVEKQVYERVKADVSEVFREKQSELHGKVRVTDNRTREVIKSVPVNVFHDFKGYGCRYTGDERALTAETKKKLDSNLELFPSDGMMADDLSHAFKDVLMTELKNIRF